MGRPSKEIPDDLLSMLRYDPETGYLYWAVSRRGNIRPGVRAGSIQSAGYVEIKYKKIKYMAHRIIWKMVHGHISLDTEIDHENTVKSDNRITNLRPATKMQNGANRAKNRNNTSGFKGVTLDHRRNRWIAQISIGGKHIWLGYYASPEEAHLAYVRAAENGFGEFARAA